MAGLCRAGARVGAQEPEVAKEAPRRRAGIAHAEEAAVTLSAEDLEQPPTKEVRNPLERIRTDSHGFHGFHGFEADSLDSTDSQLKFITRAQNPHPSASKVSTYMQ